MISPRTRLLLKTRSGPSRSEFRLQAAPGGRLKAQLRTRLISGPSGIQAERFPIRPSRGFSLVELLVVIFVIAILGSLALVGINRAQRSAEVSRVRADFQAIYQAIEAFKNDFKDYPGIADAPMGITVGNTSRKTSSLALCLVGPGDDDGAPGTGFRGYPGGKIWPAYLDAAKFKVKSGTGPNNVTLYYLLDTFGNPIEYYPRRSPAGIYAPQDRILRPATGNQPAGTKFLYEEADGSGTLFPNSLTADTLRFRLGDSDLSNSINGTERLRHSGPYILASRGRDGIFTSLPADPDPVVRAAKIDGGGSDDIFNFDR